MHVKNHHISSFWQILLLYIVFIYVPIFLYIFTSVFISIFISVTYIFILFEINSI